MMSEGLQAAFWGVAYMLLSVFVLHVMARFIRAGLRDMRIRTRRLDLVLVACRTIENFLVLLLLVGGVAVVLSKNF
jgi:hypothetical protein